MTQIHRYVCVCCEERGAFTSVFPSVRVAKTHIGKSPACLVAGLGIQALETRQTVTMVDGCGAAGPSPDLRHQPTGPTRMRKKQEQGYTIDILCISIYNMVHNSFSIYYRYTKDILYACVIYLVYTKNMLSKSSYAWFKPSMICSPESGYA